MADTMSMAMNTERRPIILAYFYQLREVLLHPVRFFSDRQNFERPWQEIVVFALVTHWIGRCCAFLWKAVFDNQTLQTYLADLLRQAPETETIFSRSEVDQWRALFWDHSREVIWNGARVVADPLTTFLSMIVSAAFIFVAARLLVSPGRAGTPLIISYEGALKVVAYGLAPSILMAFPLGGEFLSTIAVLILTVIAAREYYRVETWRATVLALFPNLLVFMAVAFAFGGVLFLLIKFFALSSW